MDSYIPNERNEFPRAMGDRDMDDVYRRRSPDPYQERRTGRPRNRSRSPIMIDRYQPDSRAPRDEFYGARNRDERRRPHSPGAPLNIDRYVPGQDAPNPAMLVNPVDNPLKLEYQVGFSYFAEWWRQDKAIKEEKERMKTGARRPVERLKGEREVREERDREKLQIQAAYDSYKEDLQLKMARTFVQAHKGEEWFKERYVPEIRDPLRTQLNECRRQNYEQWKQDLDQGLFDEFNLEGIYKNDSDGAGGAVEKEEGETVATAEVLGVADLVPSKGGDLKDMSSTLPTLLIKTISPTVRRSKLEEFCKEHLGEAEGGFKWLSLSDPNPSKKYHRIGWVILKPGGQVTEAVEAMDEDRADDEVKKDDEEPKLLKLIGPAERALEAINSKTIHDEARGEFTCHVGIHNPPSLLRKKALWDLFSAPERIQRDLELAEKVVANLDNKIGEIDGLGPVYEKVSVFKEQGLFTPTVTTSSKKKPPMRSEENWDIDRAENGENGSEENDSRTISGGEEEAMEEGEEGEEKEEDLDDEIDDASLLEKKKQLDLLVEYLRRVHNFCFFCVFECDSVHELSRKCAGGHLRRPRASLSTLAKKAAKASADGDPYPFKKEQNEEGENGGSSPGRKFQRNKSKTTLQLQRAFNWVKTYEEKLLQILEPQNVDLKKLGGKLLEEGVNDELSKFVKQEDENKFRCKVPECTKLFKAESFWRKHVEKRHTEWFENLKEDLTLVNTYVLDPAHIAPSRSDANSNGHFPQSNNSFPGGTPRGFNLNMPMGINGVGIPGINGTPGVFPTFMGMHAVTGGGNGWPGAVAGGAGGNFGEDGRRMGPIRRGGGGFNRGHHRPGPYDRRPSESRDVRWAGGAGKMSPPRGGRMGGGGGGRWGDGAGVASVGPREAVQGRSLKSYEDLDAVGGGAGGELNY